MENRTILTINGISEKGEASIEEYGNVWALVRKTNDYQGLTTEPPFLRIFAIKQLRGSYRWISLIDDNDFEIVDSKQISVSDFLIMRHGELQSANGIDLKVNQEVVYNCGGDLAGGMIIKINRMNATHAIFDIKQLHSPRYYYLSDGSREPYYGHDHISKVKNYKGIWVL